MEDNLLIKYLNDIDKEGQISQMEEIELTRDFRNGNFDALQRLVKANLRFVIYVAKQYQYLGLSLSDLISEGNIGLIKAAERFDETRGNKFITYAVYWIRESILQALNENASFIRYPRNQISSRKKIRETFEQFEEYYSNEPSDNKISSSSASLHFLETDKGDVENHIGYPGSSFESSEKDLMDDNLCDNNSFCPEKYLLEDSFKSELKRALKILTHRESSVIELYYGLNGTSPHTLEEIGKEFSMTRERVRQIKENGLKRLKHEKFMTVLKQLYEESA